MPKKITTEDELIQEMKCSDLCFVKTRLQKSDKVVDKIYDDECNC